MAWLFRLNLKCLGRHLSVPQPHFHCFRLNSYPVLTFAYMSHYIKRVLPYRNLIYHYHLTFKTIFPAYVHLAVPPAPAIQLHEGQARRKLTHSKDHKVRFFSCAACFLSSPSSYFRVWSPCLSGVCTVTRVQYKISYALQPQPPRTMTHAAHVITSSASSLFQANHRHQASPESLHVILWGAEEVRTAVINKKI